MLTAWCELLHAQTNYEHFACFEKLSRLLRCSQSAFGYAGTKDKTAVTYQHVTVRGVRPEQLLALNRTEPTSDTDGTSTWPSLEIGDLVYTSTPMVSSTEEHSSFVLDLACVCVLKRANSIHRHLDKPTGTGSRHVLNCYLPQVVP
jgi:hypothetical protein